MLNSCSRWPCNLAPAPNYGKLFETFELNEIEAVNRYENLKYKMFHWRTNHGKEVDLILTRSKREALLAIEIKSSRKPEANKITALIDFKKDNEHLEVELYCVCLVDETYVQNDIKFINWKSFLRELTVK